jgi:sugar-specific transcriptional regulator TrmB
MNKEILKEIGLTDNEVEIYITLLKHGQISAYDLAEKIGLYRQVTYDSLNRLLEKGYVSFVKEGKSRLFKAIDPQLVLAHLNEKIDGFKQMLPELSSLQQKAQDKVIVETYKGKNVLRIAFRDIINTLKENKSENLCTAVDEWSQADKQKLVLEQYERDLINYKIKERVIIKEGVRGLFKKGNTKYRYIPKKYFNPNPTQIYGNNVQTIIWGNPDHLVIVRSREVADLYRKQFELLWRSAKP